MSSSCAPGRRRCLRLWVCPGVGPGWMPQPLLSRCEVVCGLTRPGPKSNVRASGLWEKGESGAGWRGETILLHDASLKNRTTPCPGQRRPSHNPSLRPPGFLARALQWTDHKSSLNLSHGQLHQGRSVPPRSAQLDPCVTVSPRDQTDQWLSATRIRLLQAHFWHPEEEIFMANAVNEEDSERDRATLM